MTTLRFIRSGRPHPVVTFHQGGLRRITKQKPDALSPPGPAAPTIFSAAARSPYTRECCPPPANGARNCYRTSRFFCFPHQRRQRHFLSQQTAPQRFLPARLIWESGGGQKVTPSTARLSVRNESSITKAQKAGPVPRSTFAPRRPLQIKGNRPPKVFSVCLKNILFVCVRSRPPLPCGKFP